MKLGGSLGEDATTGLPILSTQMASVTSYSHPADIQVGEGAVDLSLEGKTTHLQQWVTLKEMTPHPQCAIGEKPK